VLYFFRLAITLDNISAEVLFMSLSLSPNRPASRCAGS
jgi:hypothetical protein